MPTEQTEQLLTIFKQFYDDLKLTSEDYAIEEIPAERANLEIETATIEAVQKAQELFQVEQDRIRAEVLDEVERKLPYEKSLLADLAYQGPELPKKYKIEMENYYKGFNKAIEEIKSILASLREEGRA